ncbi:PEP-CTERM sorting domain-containing protein [Phormidium sp. CLA17]|uniref:PEP-CTERM sorting domain-containing protein n=1 Tax=Leptolyngbya sp. Cla-17 TaxID=2803751 RepID=UPI0014923D4D|nr:PEP-CTERM sorting domain-containing protein [Leptolyngbya sp. Cla-17]MBM0743891.1 PEP-CTERM sorting domain-containing protein [Leptolyngbya sp. Cla-17]
MKRTLSFTSSATAFAAIGSAIAASIVATAPVHAATFSCPSGTADNVSGSSGCQYSDTANQDSVSSNKPLTVNQEGFFGLTNWNFGGKIGETAGYNGTESGQKGLWNIAQTLQPTWQNVMLVFKSGEGTSLVGYQLEKGVTSGTWTSPFENLLFSNINKTKDVSHISVYFTEGVSAGNSAAAPEPSTMAGLAIAGAGLSAYRRRRAAVKA